MKTGLCLTINSMCTVDLTLLCCPNALKTTNRHHKIQNKKEETLVCCR